MPCNILFAVPTLYLFALTIDYPCQHSVSQSGVTVPYSRFGHDVKVTSGSVVSVPGSVVLYRA